MTYRKKLIEVALPLAAINTESAREKSIRHGHPSTLHLWWARRPLAACRAVLFSSLVDDPDSDPQYLKPDGSVDEEAAGIKRADLFNLIEELVMWENSNNADVIRTARAEIARCVASRLIETGVLKKDATIGLGTTIYNLVTRGHCRPIPNGLDTKVGRVRFKFDVSGLPPAEVVNQFLVEHAPPVLDPFAGGGSIPLETQRLGLRAYASDLNPVPVLINKALIEIPPEFAGRSPVNPEARGELTSTEGKPKKVKTLVEIEWPGATGLAEDVRYYGQWIRDEAEKRIGHFYPKIEVTAEMARNRPDLLPYIGRSLSVIAWIWARTVASPNPACAGMHVPLVRSFWLAKKPGKEVFVKPVVDRERNTYHFTVEMGVPKDGFMPDVGTVVRTGATCLLSGESIPLEYVRSEGKEGRLHHRLMAVACEGIRERVYFCPTEAQERIALSAIPNDVPETDIPDQALGFRVQLYGMNKHFKLFTNRQLLALTTLSRLIGDVRKVIDHDEQLLLSKGKSADNAAVKSMPYADAVATYLAFGVSRSADFWCTIATWSPAPKNELVGHAFTKQALPITWDFAEANPFSESGGNFTGNLAFVAKVLAASHKGPSCEVRQLDATSDLSIGQPCMVSTDPPYYDNIGYADLSDFFYVWLRQSLRTVYPSLFATALTPKIQELIATPFRHGGNRSKAQQFFEHGLGEAFVRMRAVQSSEYPLTVYYAFKQAETDDENDSRGEADLIQTASTGWETMLGGLIHSGFAISGTWPVRTERTARSVGIGTNALASSIVLVCRPRPATAPLATRKEFITTLRNELPEALRNLQRGNIAPVDLAQAAIGPGMAIFTRYTKVLESDGSPMTVRTALGLINQSLDEVLAEQEGEFDGDTRWALAWFEQFGMEEGPFGDAETLSKAKNTAVNGLEEAGIISARAGKVRLVKRDELPVDWNPATDKRLTVWEVTQHLIHRLDRRGETGAAELVGQLGGIAEISRDLAYRLYSTCERKKWAQDALAYNSLVVAWPELTKLARSTKTRQTSTQQELFN
ncbi:DUF1156 domain-containing protein [Schlesneria sp. T3-172]|uniref:DUF1156 domain-containing protein n=1 Tax=Schlesneria sphaerica TaxID=3373610 RepID=UPI0037CC5E0C